MVLPDFFPVDGAAVRFSVNLDAGRFGQKGRHENHLRRRLVYPALFAGGLQRSHYRHQTVGLVLEQLFHRRLRHRAYADHRRDVRVRHVQNSVPVPDVYVFLHFGGAADSRRSDFDSIVSGRQGHGDSQHLYGADFSRFGLPVCDHRAKKLFRRHSERPAGKRADGRRRHLADFHQHHASAYPSRAGVDRDSNVYRLLEQLPVAVPVRHR